MASRSVAIGALGGTITMTLQPGRTGAAPSLGAADLVAAVPALAEVAAVEATTLMTVPGASLTVDDVRAALSWAHAAVDDGADGAVLVQGTDTLEETAYLLDLWWDRAHPLVVTGAMRPPEQAGADGPANLLAAVTTAASPAVRERGVLVVLNDQLHAAARVRKTHATATDAFSSPDTGPVGRLHEGRLVANPGSGRIRPLPLPGASRRVALVEASLDDAGELVHLVLEAGYDGIAIGAFGAGHLSAASADAVSTALQHVPVVVASRTGGGSTLTETYDFPGSEHDLARRGALLAGWLDPRKARLLLWAALSAGMSREQVAHEFAVRGGSPRAGADYPDWTSEPGGRTG